MGYRGTGTDITEQVKAETALQESEVTVATHHRSGAAHDLRQGSRRAFPAGQPRYR
jgi:hypothetical protein